VLAGQLSADFTIHTGSVSATTAVTITATAGGPSKLATLTVSPAVTTSSLTVSASGRNGETVSSSPAGIHAAVGGTSTAAFSTGTSITLSVSDGRDAIWSGACSSGGRKAKTCAFTLTANATVSANVQ
jgi:hypothetical protein